MLRLPFSGTVVVLVAALLLPAGSSRAANPNDGFNALVAAAKAEGSVVVDGPPVDAVRDALTAEFRNTYGITVSYLASGGGPSAPRVRAERAAGKYLLDVLISGSDTPVTSFLPAGWLERIEPVLIEPDAIDPKDWTDHHLWYMDPQHTILRLARYVAVELGVNTKYVKPAEIPTWKSLLDPKWKGKLLVKDPTTSGTGQSLTSYFYLTFGPDFVKKLYIDQQPVLTSNTRQAAQWLADGTHPVWVGTDFSQLDPFIKAGYPISPVQPADGPLIVTGSYGVISLLDRAPHPNAAKLFVNWLAGRAGNIVLSRALGAGSLRTDIPQPWLPAYERTKPGVTYYDSYSFKYITEQREPAIARVKELLGY